MHKLRIVHVLCVHAEPRLKLPPEQGRVQISVFALTETHTEPMSSCMFNARLITDAKIKMQMLAADAADMPV